MATLATVALDLVRKVLEPVWLPPMRQSDWARRDSETASLPPAQSLPTSSDTEAAGTGCRCRHGGCWWATRDQRTASESDLVVTTKVCSISIQRAASEKWAPPSRRTCRQAWRHSVTQRGEKSAQRKRMRLRMVLGNPRVLEVSSCSAPAIPCGCNNWASRHTHFTSICHRSVVS